MNTRKWILVSITVLAVALFAAITTAKETPGMKDLPQLVMTAVGNLFPSATVEKAEPENISIAAYEVDVKESADPKSAVIAADGSVVSVETAVTAESLPEAVSKAFYQKAKGGKILIIEKEEIFMEARLVKLAQPKTMYEAKVEMDGKTIEIEMDAAGNVLNTKADDEDEDGDDDEDNDEQVISLDKLPEAARTALVNAAQGGDIKEVESEQENGQTVYEADVIINGQEFEIKVSADGKVLEKKADKDDDDDDDDEKEDKD